MANYGLGLSSPVATGGVAHKLDTTTTYTTGTLLSLRNNATERFVVDYAGAITTGSIGASALTGTTLASNVVTSSLTTIGTLVAGAVPASLVTAGIFPSGTYAFTTNMVAGHTTTIAVGGSTPRISAHGTAGNARTALVRWSNDANGPVSAIAKSRGASVGTNAAVQSGDTLGDFAWYGDTGSAIEDAASGRLRVSVAGSVSDNRIPTTISLATAEGASDNDIADKFRVGPTGALSMLAAQKFYLDGIAASGDTYIHEASANTLVLVSGGASQLTLTSTNIALFTASGSFGSGSGVVFVANRATAPTTNPTGGGILYVESGALKFRGSSGTVTTIANA